MTTLRIALRQAEQLFATVQTIDNESLDETSEDSALLFQVGEICDELKTRIRLAAQEEIE
jgi:hypothetical protein